MAAAGWRLEEAPATDGRVVDDLVFDLSLCRLRLPLQQVVAFATAVRRLKIGSDLIDASRALIIIILLARSPAT